MTPIGTIIWEFADGGSRSTSAYGELNILAHVEIFELTLAQACGGQAECGTCRIKVLSGQVTGMLGDEAELRRDHPGKFASDERLGCRARPQGDLHVQLRGRRPEDLRDLVA